MSTMWVTPRVEFPSSYHAAGVSVGVPDLLEPVRSIVMRWVAVSKETSDDMNVQLYYLAYTAHGRIAKMYSPVT